MTEDALRKRVKESIKQFFKSPNAKKKIPTLADHYNSFEAWLNWELAYEFGRKNAWPKFTAHREARYRDDTALADICYFAGSFDNPAAECRLETKLVWNNKSKSKMVNGAIGDACYLKGVGGKNLMLVMTVSSMKGEIADPRPEKKRGEIMNEIESRIAAELGRPVAGEVVFEHESDARARFYCHPRVRATLFDIG